MKKSIAILLTASLVLSLAGCDSKESTTKKTKKTKKTTTESEETDDTSEPSETESESQTESETESESDTSESSDPNPTGQHFTSDKFVVSPRLEELGMYNIPTYHAYGYSAPIDSGSDYLVMNSVIEYCEDYYFDYDSQIVPHLADRLDNIYSSLIDQYDDMYYKELEDFIQKKDNGQTPEGNDFYCTSNYYRADILICSFYVQQGTSYSENALTCYNIRSMDGADLTLDDIILDKDAFCAYMDSYFADIPKSDITNDPDVADLKMKVQNNSSSFLLSYDAIYIFGHNDFVKIPVAQTDSTGMVDLSYFGGYPDGLTMKFDLKNEIIWDLNEDGVLDTIKFEVVRKDPTDFDFEKIVITVNGTSQEFLSGETEEDDYYGSLENAFLVHTSDGYFVELYFAGEDMYFYTPSFHVTESSIEKGGITYGQFTHFPVHNYNFELSNVEDILGTHRYVGDYSMSYHNGKGELRNELIYTYGALMETDVDLTAMQINKDRSEVGEKTIPAGTPIGVVCYDTDFKTVIIETLHPDDTENEYFELPLDMSEWPGKINGTPVDEIFRALHFAG